MDKGKAPSAAGESPAINPTLWKAITGSTSNMPSAGSNVYYFPDGHAEQCSPPLPRIPRHIMFPCRLAAVNLHADPTTEQTFATFTLTTRTPPETHPRHPPDEIIFSAAKILSENEASRKSTSALNLPESADDVFRHSPAGEFVNVYDLNGRGWKLRHVVAGRPARRFLTDGWGVFVANKLLVAGDAVVFARDDEGTIFTGLRRDEDECDAGEMKDESTSRMMRVMKMKEDPELAEEAMRWAGEGGGEGAVEGTYYPDSKMPVYVVRKEVVERAAGYRWVRGMRVAKAYETADGFAYLLFGTIKNVSLQAHVSPWRMLEIIWDEIFTKTFESPWEVKPLPYIKVIPKEETQKEA